MAIRVKRHANVSKRATLLDVLDVSPLKRRVCGCGFNRFVHKGMNQISIVKVHLNTRSGNVNIVRWSASLLFACNKIRSRGYKTFVILNSAGHEIYPAYKCQNANDCWHLTFISMEDTISERLKASNFFICRYFSFYEQLKFRVQLI